VITTGTVKPIPLRPDEFHRLVQDHVDGMASEQTTALLQEHRESWIAALYRIYDDAALALDEVGAQVKGPERSMVLSDFEADLKRVDRVLSELLGPSDASKSSSSTSSESDPAGVVGTGTVQLQLSWAPGKVIAWAAGHGAQGESRDDLVLRLQQAGAGTVGWEEHAPVKLPDQSRVDAVTAPIGAVIGWLTALGTTTDDDSTGASVAWMGLATAMAVRLAVQGRVVPQLRKARRARSNRSGEEGTSPFAVRWVPAIVDTDEVEQLANSLPGTVSVFENRPDSAAMTNAVVSDLITAICIEAASRLETPAAPPDPQTKSDVAESFLARLDGESFVAPSRLASELGRRLDQWARPVTSATRPTLVLQLDPPDESNAWYLAVLGKASDGNLAPVEQVIVNSSASRRKEVEGELVRLERLYDELLRPGGRRRGEVILSQEEAWKLMTVDGQVLAAAGFEVRAPQLSLRKPTPSLRLTSEEHNDTQVGAQQLADVRWSVIFDDVELTAAEIADLALQARPLVKSRGRWVELDQADLQEAAAALAERADKTRLSGADMLRHALGLDATPFSGGVTISGGGWAADLLRKAADLPEDAPTKPEGFVGELRSYQADARMWLSYLDDSGLGGCLALDMGLGKTPTMLAHLQVTAERGPALVIAPPAVVGNWAAEAAKFVPEMVTVVHHGPSRAAGRDIANMVAGADLVITTYGTAVRDVEALEKVDWAKVVLDEAQAIKNSASETAQQLRRIEARTRVALTGTPIENGLGDLWAIMDYTNPGLVGPRAAFVSQLSRGGTSKEGAENALKALNGILVYRRTKAEPAIASELPDRIDELDLCSMTTEQIGLYQAVLNSLIVESSDNGEEGPKAQKKGAVLAAITALKQICNHPAAYQDDGEPLDGRSGKLARLNEIVDNVFAAEERVLIFTHFASWGEKLATYLTNRTNVPVACYHGGLGRTARDNMVAEFQAKPGRGALVLSLKAGGTGLNLTAANHVVLYDRWWNPAVEDQARDRVWRIGQKNTVICHRLVCPGTVDERVEEIVAGKRQIADMVLPKSSSLGDLDSDQLRKALGIDEDLILAELDDELVASDLAAPRSDSQVPDTGPQTNESSDTDGLNGGPPTVVDPLPVLESTSTGGTQ